MLRPFILLCLFVWSIPMQEIVQIDFLGSVSKTIGWLMLVIYIIDLLRRGKFRKYNLTIVSIVIFFIWAILSVYWSINARLTLGRLSTYFQLVILVLIIWDLSIESHDREKLMIAYVLGNFIGILMTVLRLVNSSGLDYMARISALNLDPNDFALMIAVSIPMAWYVAVKNQNNKIFYFGCIYVGMAIITILATGSRGGFISCVVAVMILPMLFSRLKVRRRIFTIIVLLMLIYPLALLVPGNSFERILGIGNQITEGSMSQRKYIWEAGFAVYKQHKILGVGAGTFRQAIISFTSWDNVAHNTYLGILVELGTIGLFLFIIVLIRLLKDIMHMFHDEARVFIILLLTWGIGVSSLSWEYMKTTWFIIALMASAGQSYKMRKYYSPKKRINT